MPTRSLARGLCAVPGFVLLACLLRLAFTPFGLVLAEDGFGYLVKAREIASGDLLPMSTHAIGWPLALAPFVGMAGGTHGAGAMAIARLVSIAAGTAILFPLARLARELVDPASMRLALLFTAVSAVLITSAWSAMAEPLFTLLLVGAVASMVRARGAARTPWWAGALAGLAWWVRPHGLLAAFALVLAAATDRREGERLAAPLRRAAAVGLVACAVAAPAAIQRHAAFGSPLTFGANDKILLAAEKEHVWSPNVPVVSLRDFLGSMTPGRAFDRVVVDGAGRVAVQFTLYVATPLLVPFVLAAAWRRRHDPAFRPVLVVTGVWLAGVAGLAGVGTRHLYPIAPLSLLLAADGVRAAAARSRVRPAVVAAFVVVIVAQSLVTAAWHRHRETAPEVADAVEWGRWAAGHVRGRLAIVEGSAFVMMHLPDTRVAGVGLMDLYAPATGLSVVRPGTFDTLAEAMAWMRSAGVTHLAVDDLNIERRPYLKAVRDPAARPRCLRLVYSNEATAIAWRQRIFEIRWAECDPREVSAQSFRRSSDPR
ncbi:MAG: glycosyltransferase family 39 protein [Acidobacteria bacterium]|nr:glycosyltransferase family 39 protein [Acidobacteriota bacterium]